MVAARSKLVRIFLIGLFLTSIVLRTPQSVSAADSCTATVSPSSVQTTTETSFSFSITNTGSGTINYIQLVAPSANFTLHNYGVAGWSITYNSSVAELSGGSIAAGDTFNFSFSATSGGSEAGSANWQIITNSGGDSVSCTGSLGTAISGIADIIAPQISSLSISDITDTSVKITWVTDENSTSVVEYGTTDAYGTTSTDATLTSSHSVTLTGLTANTTYYYFVRSVDSIGNNAESDTGTFVTAKAGTTSTTTTTTTTTATATPTPKPATDKTAPVASIDTDFDKPFREPPKITGKASDTGAVNVGVASVDYSLDDGKNWLAVDTLKKKGGKSVTFDFTPPPLEDDNYKIRVRATDNSGNRGLSKTYTMVIDRLPPRIGATYYSLGAQPLTLNSDGILVGVAGLSQTITLSAVGGPIQIQLKTQNSKLKSKDENLEDFKLIKSSDNGLWSGILKFDDAGIYELIADSVDGAGNKVTQKLNPLLIIPQGKITDGKAPVSDATISLYYQDFATKNFVLWDGKSYGQQNPQKTDKEGMYKLFVPPGKYYIEIKSNKYRRFVSNIFTVDRSIPLNNDFTLEEKKGFSLGPIYISFFDFAQTTGKITVRYPVIPEELKQRLSFVGKELPSLDLKDGDKTVNANSFRGKPMFLTILSSWNPFSSQQINILNSLKKNNETNYVIVFPQETASRISTLKKRGGYSLSMLADPDGALITALSVQTFPIHISLNRKGVIERVTPGVLTVDEIEKNLIN